MALTLPYSCDGNVGRDFIRDAIKRLHTETLQRRLVWSTVSRFHRNYMITSERHRIATLQRSCRDFVVFTGKQVVLFPKSLYSKILFQERT